jgi:hypothetical protein
MLSVGFLILRKDGRDMLRDVNHIKGFRIHATDGDIGHVKEFYFDDKKWGIRYLIADTGNWLTGRKVLISPEALLKPDWTGKKFPVKLSKEQVMNSPSIDFHLMVTREHEYELHKYYGWRRYWAEGAEELMAADVLPDNTSGRGDTHLRSTDFLIGFAVHGIDGDIGYLDDFVVDDDTWAIRYIVVDTQHWVTGKKVLVCPDWIREINLPERKIFVNFNREKIQSVPEFDPSVPISRGYEEKLFEHYGCRKYWI